MKSQSKGILLFFGLLASCGGCKKDTDPATTPAEPTCLIATQTMKELVSASQQSKLDPETVSINGESFQVSTTQKSSYTYDQQRRILTEYNQYSDQKFDSVYYEYTPTSVNIRTVTIAATRKTVKSQELALNSQGLVEHRPDTYEAMYDKDGYLVSLKYIYGIAEIVNGNVIDKPFGGDDATPTYTYKYEYDLNKLGLIPVQTFYGKESRNLLTRYTIENDRFHSLYGSSYTSTYAYTFDHSGRIKRQILRGKQGDAIGFLFEIDKVIVKDFSYTCP